MDLEKDIPDEAEFSPHELSVLLNVRLETVYRWLNHPTMTLPHKTVQQGFNKIFTIKGKDIKDYFKLRRGEEEDGRED